MTLPEFTDEEAILLRECDIKYDEQSGRLNLHYSEPNFYSPHALEHRRRINELMDSLMVKLDRALSDFISEDRE